MYVYVYVYVYVCVCVRMCVCVCVCVYVYAHVYGIGNEWQYVAMSGSGVAVSCNRLRYVAVSSPEWHQCHSLPLVTAPLQLIATRSYPMATNGNGVAMEWQCVASL